MIIRWVPLWFTISVPWSSRCKYCWDFFFSCGFGSYYVLFSQAFMPRRCHFLCRAVWWSSLQNPRIGRSSTDTVMPSYVSTGERYHEDHSWAYNGLSCKVFVILKEHSLPLIGTPLLPSDSVLVSKVSFGEREHNMHLWYLLPKICVPSKGVSSLESRLRDRPLYSIVM